MNGIATKGGFLKAAIWNLRETHLKILCSDIFYGLQNTITYLPFTVS